MSGKRKAAPAGTSETASAPAPRRSKLAKEHNISAIEENEIKEAFSLFSEPKKGEKEGVLPTNDVKRAMVALNIAPTPTEHKEFLSILDPENEGFTDYASFVAICALKMHNRAQNSESHRAEVDEAFSLFTSYPLSLQGGQQHSAVEELLRGEDGEERITLSALKRVARALKEDVDEALLRDMILEANGGKGVGKGVGKEEFEGVMRRAGVWR